MKKNRKLESLKDNSVFFSSTELKSIDGGIYVHGCWVPVWKPGESGKIVKQWIEKDGVAWNIQ